MSTEDDLATVQAVTDRLAGPLKVWVLEISTDDHETFIHLHYTREGALDMVRIDLADGFTNPPDDAEMNRILSVLTSAGGTSFRDTTYSLKRQEIKP